MPLHLHLQDECLLANVALVGLFSRVNPHVSFELESVGAGVGAVGALVGTLAGVATHVSLELAQFHAGVVTLGALVGLLVGVPVAYMTHQLAGSGETRVAKLATVRLCSRVSVDVILKTGGKRI